MLFGRFSADDLSRPGKTRPLEMGVAPEHGFPPLTVRVYRCRVFVSTSKLSVIYASLLKEERCDSSRKTFILERIFQILLNDFLP